MRSHRNTWEMYFFLLAVLCFFNLGALQGRFPHNQRGSSSIKNFIDEINSKATTWRAGQNFGGLLSLAEMHKRVGTLIRHKKRVGLQTIDHSLYDSFRLPESLDARLKWPQCKSTSEIRNQGSCGSCWAFAAVEVMTDRQCIHSNGTKNFHYSANDVISCCFTCGFGCRGGYVDRAFDFWRFRGIVSGGSYNSKQGCSPYQIPDDNHYHETPKCARKCQENYNISFEEDKHHGQEIYLVASGEYNIMQELNQNGPITATMKVYQDFFHYRKGVYKYSSGPFAGYHAIKIIGYGKENGVKYWLCSNSWGKDWGEEGFFKILRGDDECGIEEFIFAGIPRL